MKKMLKKLLKFVKILIKSRWSARGFLRQQLERKYLQSANTLPVRAIAIQI